MNADARPLLAEALTALADDELILAHRDSEWTGHAPILEEDIAFANIALDELGHAGIWYRLAADLLGEDGETYPDRQIFHRSAGAYRNVRLVEQPKGDWAYTVVRQYLFDACENLRLERLRTSAHRPLAEAAGKILTEERYHLRHGRAWVRRLGRGTEESRRRMQAALDSQWDEAGQLLAPLPSESNLVAAGLWPPSDELRERWEEETRAFLEDSGLKPPGRAPQAGSGRERHTEHLAPLLDQLQSVARLEAEASW